MFWSGHRQRDGVVIGQSDQAAKTVKHTPCSPVDINATISQVCNFPLDDKLLSPSGRPFRIANQGVPPMELLS